VKLNGAPPVGVKADVRLPEMMLKPGVPRLVTTPGVPELAGREI